MSKDKSKIVTTLNLKLSDNKISEKITESVKEFKNKGIDEINITIKGSAVELVKKSNFSIKSFKKIKTTQDLPDWVVYGLITSSGKLKDTESGKRIKNAKT